MYTFGPWLMPSGAIGLIWWCIDGFEWLAILPMFLAGIILLDIYWKEEERKSRRALKGKD